MGDLEKIIYVHVPAAWIMSVTFAIVMFYSLRYLWRRDERDDLAAAAAAEVGTVLNGLTLVLGMIWGKPTWGVWWAWDARLTSTLVLFLIFVGYLSLRAFVDDPERRAQWSAAVGILGAINVPIVYMSVRWWRTLHQMQSSPSTVDRDVRARAARQRVRVSVRDDLLRPAPVRGDVPRARGGSCRGSRGAGRGVTMARTTGTSSSRRTRSRGSRSSDTGSACTARCAARARVRPVRSRPRRAPGGIADDRRHPESQRAKRRPLAIAAVVVGRRACSAWLLYGGLDKNVVFFLTPQELLAKGTEGYDVPVRLGGQVKPGSVKWDDKTLRLTFEVTDGTSEIPVQSSGAPPQMFRDGMGVVVEGRFGRDHVFNSPA